MIAYFDNHYNSKYPISHLAIDYLALSLRGLRLWRTTEAISMQRRDCGASSEQSEESPSLLLLRLATSLAMTIFISVLDNVINRISIAVYDDYRDVLRQFLLKPPLAIDNSIVDILSYKFWNKTCCWYRLTTVSTNKRVKRSYPSCNCL